MEIIQGHYFTLLKSNDNKIVNKVGNDINYIN